MFAAISCFIVCQTTACILYIFSLICARHGNVNFLLIHRFKNLHKKIRRQHIFASRLQLTIVCAKELNFRVRDGNGCVLFAIVTGCLMWHVYATLTIEQLPIYIRMMSYSIFNDCVLFVYFWSSPRPISISRLNTLLHLHS